MRTFILKSLTLIMLLGAQIFAQKFTYSNPDFFETGSYGTVTNSKGYLPGSSQAAILGEQNSIYANLMLLPRRDSLLIEGQNSVGIYNVVSTYGNVLGLLFPFREQNVFKTSNGDFINDHSVRAAVVLDSLNDNKKTATVLFASLRKLIVMKITINNSNGIESQIQRSIDMPETMWQTGTMIKDIVFERRLALLGTSLDDTDKTYHLAIGNPNSKNGIYENSGRVDFFSIRENSWIFSQPNSKGLANGENGLFFGEGSMFGRDVAVIENFDKKGGKALVVLLPSSVQYPQSAIYIFSMDNNWTPNANSRIAITGTSMPWLESSVLNQNCVGLGLANWDSEHRLLMSCIARKKISEQDFRCIIIKEFALDSTGKISNTSEFYSDCLKADDYRKVFFTRANPISIKKHKNDLNTVVLGINAPTFNSGRGQLAVLPVMNADYSKNFSIEAGKSEIIVNIDSLFYKSGTTGFIAKTLYGLVQCGVQSGNLLCVGGENAAGSWSSIELSSESGCNLYRTCKRKDTVFVYVRSQSESNATALRMPKSILIPFFKQLNLNNLKSLSYFKNPELQNTSTKWNPNDLKLSVAASYNSNELSIVPFSQKEGIDTLVFNLSISAVTNSYPVHLHIADTARILMNAIPANPGSDTVWNTAQKRYIELPRSSSNGSIYTYDIAQNNLMNYAEIVDNYLYISKVDFAEITIAYTENSKIKHRELVLIPEPKTILPLNSSGDNSSGSSFAETDNPFGSNGEPSALILPTSNSPLATSQVQYYNLQGQPLGTSKPTAQGVYIARFKTGQTNGFQNKIVIVK